jgi:hypothetical protein
VDEEEDHTAHTGTLKKVVYTGPNGLPLEPKEVSYGLSDYPASHHRRHNSS